MVDIIRQAAPFLCQFFKMSDGRSPKKNANHLNNYHQLPGVISDQPRAGRSSCHLHGPRRWLRVSTYLARAVKSSGTRAGPTAGPGPGGPGLRVSATAAGPGHCSNSDPNHDTVTNGGDHDPSHWQAEPASASEPHISLALRQAGPPAGIMNRDRDRFKVVTVCTASAASSSHGEYVPVRTSTWYIILVPCYRTVPIHRGTGTP